MKFIKITEVMEKTSLARSTIYDLIKKEQFPKQIKVSERAACWLESDVLEWMQAKIENRLH